MATKFSLPTVVLNRVKLISQFDSNSVTEILIRKNRSLFSREQDAIPTIAADNLDVRDPTRIVTVRLVDLRLQPRSHVPRLNTDRRQARFGKCAVKPLR